MYDHGVDYRPDTPKHAQIAAVLRTRIENKTYPPGSALPGETTLAADFGVNRDTVRKAIRSLRLAGLVHSVRGLGTFVND